ncbi:PREDICTED: elongation of very long chain fatty acids protein 7 [Nicrophorus vespilloides]|uniref:Elongation of very long chain fatty acids protein n=1 Tax=Nicrophorus vespilloides TaxID=110193 RepID=A0ABM1MRH7_NICVS|nr:PREDICTED: elongation of very long chain fatty acids protein 7 [Nicrophorus vespilloides]XP_017777177.1 PREDICTED: elongation of very long chain fatty acids protein 7 [Nicrophorus vespilloides]
MTSLMHLVVENYNELLESKKDPIVDSWPLMGSPVPVLILLGAYLYFVLKLGPEWMANRQAFELKHVLIGYNLYQMLFSLWLCCKAFGVKDGLEYIFTTSCSDPHAYNPLRNMVTDAAWWYFLSKLVELLDTVFFILRKKQSQVTFLHVYHHSIMMIFSWAYLKFLPGEQGVLIGFLNSCVHVIMYFYYLIAAMGPRYQKYLWWKKYMTWIQLGQFCIMLAYLTLIIVMDCQLPKALTFFFVANVVIFLYLFGNFYRKAYTKPGVGSNRRNEFLSVCKLN